MKICTHGPVHMTKMAGIPTYGKNFSKIFFFGISITFGLSMKHFRCKSYQVCSNDDPWLIFYSIFVILLLIAFIFAIILHWMGPLVRVPTSSGNHGKPGKSLKKFHVWKNHGF